HLALYDESDAWARRSIALGERHGDLAADASGWEFIAENAFGRGQWRGAVDAARRDREVGERIGSLDRVAWGSFAEAWGLLIHGELAEARARARAGADLAESIAEGRVIVFLLGILAMSAAHPAL